MKNIKAEYIFPASCSLKLLYKNIEVTSIPCILITSTIIKKHPDKTNDLEIRHLDNWGDKVDNWAESDKGHLFHYIMYSIHFSEISDYLDLTTDIKDIINDLWGE
ncbi:MAG: hypothetical protein AB1775_11220, partial [Bacteroidota bacterium]